jgi:hypothetical protein
MFVAKGLTTRCKDDSKPPVIRRLLQLVKRVNSTSHAFLVMLIRANVTHFFLFYRHIRAPEMTELDEFMTRTRLQKDIDRQLLDSGTAFCRVSFRGCDIKLLSRTGNAHLRL